MGDERGGKSSGRESVELWYCVVLYCRDEIPRSSSFVVVRHVCVSHEFYSCHLSQRKKSHDHPVLATFKKKKSERERIRK